MSPEVNAWLITILRDWTWGALLNGFCVNLIRPLLVLLPVLIIFGGVGRALGLPLLFRKRHWWDQLWIGAGVGVLLWQLVLAGYLFEEFATNYTVDRPPFCERKPVEWNLKSTNLGALPEGTPEEQRYQHIPASAISILKYAGALVVGVTITMVAMGLLLLLVRGAIQWNDRLRRRWGKYVPEPPPPPSKLPPVGLLIVGILAGFGGMAGLAFLILPGTFTHTPPARWDQRVAYTIGAKVIDLAGYGNAAAREAIWNVLQANRNTSQSDLQAQQASSIASARTTKELYYSVYGLFWLGALLATIVTAWLVTDPVVTIMNRIRTTIEVKQSLRRAFSPAAGLIFILHLVLGVQTLFDYFFPYPHVAYLAVIGLGFLFARQYKLHFAKIRKPGEALQPLGRYGNVVEADYTTEKTTGVTVTRAGILKCEDIGHWNDERNKKPLILACTSGGGSRAAAWTIAVLTELERQIGIGTRPALPQHIRLFTGASGGMVGAAHYVSSITGPDQKRDSDFLKKLNQDIRGDYLTPVVHTMLTRDMPGWFLPRSRTTYFADYDRGAALEFGLKRDMPHLGMTFSALRQGELEGWRPSLVFSPMMIEDGRQLLISNLDLQNIVHNEGSLLLDDEKHQLTRELFSREGIEFFKLFPDAHEFEVVTAARMSASFPFVFPAVPLPTDPRRRVVDAGYYDNYGVTLAASWLFNNMAWVEKYVSKVAVIQIRDGSSRAERLMLNPGSANPGFVELALDFLKSPIDGLLAARVSSNMFRNDNLLQLLHKTYRTHFGAGFLKCPAFEFPGGGDVQLNFCLTEEEGELIDGEHGIRNKDVQTAMSDFLKWW